MKSNKINIIIITVCTLLIIGVIVFVKMNHKDISEAQRFKNEFEAYNNSKDELGNDCLELSISDDNPFEIIHSKKALDIIKNDKALILFGYSFDNKTRSVINMIIDVAKEVGAKKIYYVDIYNIRDVYESNNTLDPKLVRKGTNIYHEMVDILKEKLNDYYVYSGNIGFETGVKTIDTPTLLAIEKGSILSINVGLFQKEKLNEQETEILRSNYKSVMKTIYNDVCTADSNC